MNTSNYYRTYNCNVRYPTVNLTSYALDWSSENSTHVLDGTNFPIIIKPNIVGELTILVKDNAFTSIGHTTLILTKINGTLSVTQGLKITNLPLLTVTKITDLSIALTSSSSVSFFWTFVAKNY